MIIADALIDPQLIGFLTNKFSQLSMRCRAPPRARGLKRASHNDC